jgi:two-component system, OmpR family, response regulator
LIGDTRPLQVTVSNCDHSSLVAKGAFVQVLLVEDNVAIGNAVHDHLRAEDWAVDWRLDLASANLAVSAQRYDAIALDLRLPDGSGLELLRKIGTMEYSTPVVIMTAYDQLSDQMQGLGIGAVDYIVKPFALSELVARLRRLMVKTGGACPPAASKLSLSRTG